MSINEMKEIVEDCAAFVGNIVVVVLWFAVALSVGAVMLAGAVWILGLVGITF